MGATAIRVVEYLNTEGQRQPMQDGLGIYYFDLHPDLIPDSIGFVFRLSDCLHTPNNPVAPGWVGVYGTDVEPDEDAPVPHFAGIEDDDERPEGSPLRVRVTLPYLEPRYGDAYAVFILPAGAGQ